MSNAQNPQLRSLIRSALAKYRSWYGHEPEIGSFAPGRVEVLGNHTDYNEGLVLSAAIDFGTVFLASNNRTDTCRLVAGDLMEERTFPLTAPKPFTDHMWANYVMGVTAGLRECGAVDTGFDGLFFGNVPIGSGLSSSAALEISSGFALANLFGATVTTTDMARIGQRAEHEYVGAKTGLLDQISSLSGKEHHLVHTDFRSLEITNVPFDAAYVLLTCDTQTKHALGESDYNERREACEQARDYFAAHLDHPVAALRDVSSAELGEHEPHMPGLSAKRASHVIGETERVIAGSAFLADGDMTKFGELMYASHDSSRYGFENSCEELDFLVDSSKETGKVLGARLSGGGFGGSSVMLLRSGDVETVVARLQEKYVTKFGAEFVPHVIHVSDGARLIDTAVV
jgi:galactokinase